MKYLSRVRNLAAAGIAAAAMIGSATPSHAVTFDLMSGAGFISRGDVISHPTLGKTALVNGPSITFSRNGAHYEQRCYKTTGQFQVKVFVQGLSNVQFTLDTRNAPGNDNISGYVLRSAGAPGPAPTNICPGGWAPYLGSVVTVVGGNNNPPLLFFRTGAIQGGWYYNFTTATWLLWQ